MSEKQIHRPSLVVISVRLQVAALVTSLVAFIADLVATGYVTPTATGLAVVLCVAFAGLWLLIAVATWRGRNWARVLLTVLLPLQVGLAVFDAVTLKFTYDAFDYFVCALAAAAVVLLWLPNARRFFAESGANRKLRAESRKVPSETGAHAPRSGDPAN